MATIDESDDEVIRAAAFSHIQHLAKAHGHISSDDLSAGFRYAGARVPFVNPQRGIFKPKQMKHLLSVRTVFPRQGARVWYDDQRDVHRQIYLGQETVEYSFMGADPQAPENRWLQDAYMHRTPIIYFLGIAPGRYEAILPTFVVDCSAQDLAATLAFSNPSLMQSQLHPVNVERRYALRTVQQRLHQAAFRAAVLGAYDGYCALSGIGESALLDAAHIVDDGNEILGQPVVPNGIPLSKLHHAAFDASLLGVDPHFRIHVSRKLLLQKGRDPLTDAVCALDQQQMRLPKRLKDRPDPDRLAVRFEQFQLKAEL